MSTLAGFRRGRAGRSKPRATRATARRARPDETAVEPRSPQRDHAAVERSPDRTAASVTRAERKSNGVHKNDTSRRRSQRRAFTRNTQLRRRDGVHKNETPAESAIDSLPAGVRFVAHTASIHAVDLFPPPSVDDAEAEPNSTQRSNHRARAPHPHRLADPRRSLSRCRRAPTASRLIIGGSTSVLPLAQKLATAYHKAYPKIPAPAGRGRPVGHRHQRRGDGALRHRRLLARPAQRPTRKASCSRRSRATACA